MPLSNLSTSHTNFSQNSISSSSNSTDTTDIIDHNDQQLFGDVEMTLFRTTPSSSSPTHLDTPTYQRYISHPLSMFSEDTQLNTTQPSSSSSTSLSSTSSSSTQINHHNDHVNWRERVLQSCADLLQKTIPQLQQEFTTITNQSSTLFNSSPSSFDLIPRDLTDYAVMQILRTNRDFEMKTATSWLFNIMARVGPKYVFRDEFILYAPFIHPIADNAVASIIFDQLVHQQVLESQSQQSNTNTNNNNNNNNSSSISQTSNNLNQQSNVLTKTIFSQGIRRRNQNTNSNQSTTSSSIDRTNNNTDSSQNQDSSNFSSGQLYPPGSALGYDMWRRYFEAVQEKYNYVDADWIRVKCEVGIDPREVLIKSQSALDHSDIFPTVGKLFLSQRYLIFFAFVGRNHYVARLGAVSKVSSHTVNWMIRDCVMVHLETERQAAIDGISGSTREATLDDSSESNGFTTPQHIGKLMRRFTAGSKPLVFSLFEFRPPKRRDNWVNLIREMVAAHRLHVQLHFGNSGRAHPSNDNKSRKHINQNGTSSEEEDKNQSNPSESSLLQSVNYTSSPFRDEPAPPLLAIAAHSNIARYRALRRITKKEVSTELLIFSQRENNINIIDWYADSVRAYNDRKGKSLFERALSMIRENMQTNERVYRAQDDEPFDITKLGDAIGRFAELCSPLVRVIQLLGHLSQWRNPPATILAILIGVWIAAKGLVCYIPATLFFFQAAWVVETKFNLIGLGMGRMESEDAERRQANVLAMVSQVSQVYNTLEVAQNVLMNMNRELGKVQSLFLWGCEEWQSWIAVGFLCTVGMVLLILPSNVLALFFFFMLFFKHFLPPMNPGLRFWQSVPSRHEARTRNI